MDDSNELEFLKRENAELRDKLARATTAAEMYKLTVHEWLKTIPCDPLTDQELKQMQEGPFGRPPLEVIEEFERTHLRDGE